MIESIPPALTLGMIAYVYGANMPPKDPYRITTEQITDSTGALGSWRWELRYGKYNALIDFGYKDTHEEGMIAGNKAMYRKLVADTQAASDRANGAYTGGIVEGRGEIAMLPPSTEHPIPDFMKEKRILDETNAVMHGGGETPDVYKSQSSTARNLRCTLRYNARRLSADLQRFTNELYATKRPKGKRRRDLRYKIADTIGDLKAIGEITPIFDLLNSNTDGEWSKPVELPVNYSTGYYEEGLRMPSGWMEGK